MDYEQHFQKSAEKRELFWKNRGNLDPYVIAHIINPSFMGGPTWPSLRQAFVTIDTPTCTIIASDGLSDPYSDYDSNPKNQPYNGLGFEVYMESPEKITDHELLKKSWQFNLVYQMSQFAAGNGNLINMLQEYTYISTELYDIPAPENFLNEDGRVGVLLGLKNNDVPKQLKLSIETILMVNVKLLTLAEIKYIIQNGEAGRNKIAEKLLAGKNPGYSYLDRPSVV
jgi:hypothetical protein